MGSFADTYRTTYATLGHPLEAADELSASRQEAAENRLGIRIPKALREYYRVAGAEENFNRIFNRLLDPKDWFLDAERLVFMEENQAVVFWGVAATDTPTDDPPVFLGVNGDPIAWYPEHAHCSAFLQVMLHWHGAFGGAMKYCSTARVSSQFSKKLKRGWRLVGEINKMRAYNRDGRAICLLKWDDWPGQPAGRSLWRIFAGAVNERSLDQMAAELRVKWDDPTA